MFNFNGFFLYIYFRKRWTVFEIAKARGKEKKHKKLLIKFFFSNIEFSDSKLIFIENVIGEYVCKKLKERMLLYIYIF